MESKILILTCAAITLLSGMANSARILALVPTPSGSHHIWNSALLVGLAKRGHQITALSPDPPMESLPNLKHMILEGSYDKVQEVFDLEAMVHHSTFTSLQDIWLWGTSNCEYQLSTKAAKDLLLLPPDSFDLILVEVLFNECMFLYLHHFGGGTRIPVVGMSAFGIGPWTDILTGARTMPSIFALPILPHLSRMNTWERLYNTIFTSIEWVGMLYYSLPQHQKMAENLYGKPLPPLLDIGSNISLILVNNHFALNGPQPQLPGIVEVGALQCAPPKALPKDLQEFLDGAERGAIFFSLGSNLKSELLPKEKLKVILDTFAALGPKIRVLWKFDPKVPIEGLPSNVLIRKWLPQEDVLGHPKVLAFVSHAGLLSTTEALYHGKPVVAIPFFVDQHTNTKRLMHMKVAEHVDFLTITKETFTKKILNVINDPSYRRNVHKISSLIRDQPESPLDRAIFWTEFTLRHGKGRVEALRSAGLDLAWYQYFLLDVFAIIFAIIAIPTVVVMYIIIALYRMFVKTSSSKDSKDRSKVKSKKNQ